jgi:hypothetical protein
MAAIKLIFKRSSILGKRPTGANLEAGEIALNTNSNDSGLFFEVNDGSVVKAGPTAYLAEPPTLTPALGELWVDRDTKTLSIGTESNLWQKVAAPFLGGTNGYTVFVAPDYPNSTDSLANDGQTVPFITINRAILEVSKQIILQANSDISLGNNRYLIILAPGRHCVINGPGNTVSSFTVDYSSPYTDITQNGLQQFNPVTGGLILPRGVSIIGLDLKKCEVHPVYVPTYTHPAFPPNYQQDPNGGPVYTNQPITSVFKWSGNTYVSMFNCQDKIDTRTVVSVSTNSSGVAIFKSDQPHGLNYNDFVQVNYTNSADQAGASFTSGSYYVYPVNSFEFQVANQSWGISTSSPVLSSSLPSSFLKTKAGISAKFIVSNIYPYYIPLGTNPYELSSYSHHRLSVLGNASLVELNDFYIKVQRAFPNLFAGQVNKNVVTAPEYEIVSSTDGAYPNNISSNSTDNSSPYQNMVNHRSDYGMANGNYDANLVTGFKSVIINSSTAVILQKDPAAYELYADSDQRWRTLCESAQQSLPVGTPITSVPTSLQLQELNDASIPNVRYYYQPFYLANGKSTGVSDPEFDFRHFGFKMTGANSFMQAQSTYSIGAAIGCWAREGSIISLTNATTNFGSVAFQADGFAGIGTLGGANTINKGFLQAGISRPLALTEPQVISDSQKKTLSLGSKVVFVGADPNNSGIQLVYLQAELDPATILPFSLKPGSAIFVGNGGCTFRGFFVTNGQPTCILSGSPTENPYSSGGAVLRLRSSDSNIPNGASLSTCLEIPYIRRFIDPRSATQKAYGFYIQSTNPTSQAPQLGSVLRLNQTGQNLSTTLKRNYQFDPGQFGGIAQVFTVDLVEPIPYNQSINFNNKISDTAQATGYSVYASLTDGSTPWVQTIPDSNGNLVPFLGAQGTYITFNDRNYFAAENDIWTSLYYKTTFNSLNGPLQVSPNKKDSPYVTTSVLERQEPISVSWQGYVPDPYYGYYTSGAIPSPYKETLTYMRGAVVPYQDFAGSSWIDDDDSTDNFGIIFSTNATPLSTVTTAVSTIVQKAVQITSQFVANSTFGQPEIISLSLLQVSQLVNPKNGLSIVQLSGAGTNAVEYLRVIGIKSNTITAIRNYYPAYSSGNLPAAWPVGTQVKVCTISCFPEPSVYDPDWTITKSTILRYYQLMGYSNDLIKPFLTPRYAGERILLNSELPYSPINGYANTTASWPIEFNNPSAIIANTHTWQYVGYFDYSRGLSKYQVNEISRKLQYDFFSTTSWGGRLTVVGADQTGAITFLGPIREAITGNYYLYNSPAQNFSDNVVTPTPQPVDNYPAPVLVYSADDISAQFNGSQTVFNLTRGGIQIPTTQLSKEAMFVTVGGVMQIPGNAYTLGTSSGVTLPVIVFSSPPPAGASCDIRIVTSEDNNKTVQVLSYTATPSFDGTQSTFTLSPSDSGINNGNSFIYLSGVAQTPQESGYPNPAYAVVNTLTSTSLNFIGGSPLAGLPYDFRAIVSGSHYRSTGTEIVNVISVDDISVFFDNAISTFALYVGNQPLNSDLVNAENMFVTLGAVVQIPHNVAGNPLSGNAYTVQVNPVTNLLEITFASPPPLGCSCTIRVVSSEPKELIICPLPPGLADQTLVAGDGVKSNADGEIIAIDAGLIA